MGWVRRALTCTGDPLGEAGYSLAELVVVVALIGILSIIMIPFFLSYYQAAAARADVQQVMTLLNQAREVAIKQNDTVCVTFPSSTRIKFLLSTCAGTAWVGAGTDAAGNINMPAGFTLSPLNTVTFNYLGAAGAATTYTLTNSTTGGTRTISIALNGRVTSP